MPAVTPLPADQALERHFLEARSKLLDLAAILDRIGRGQSGAAVAKDARLEPPFWAGFDRGTAEGSRDYAGHPTKSEPKRAAQFSIRHYSWLCINAKEAENVKLSREVIAMIPEFLNCPNVLGIGEIGLN